MMKDCSLACGTPRLFQKTLEGGNLSSVRETAERGRPGRPGRQARTGSPREQGCKVGESGLFGDLQPGSSLPWGSEGTTGPLDIPRAWLGGRESRWPPPSLLPGDWGRYFLPSPGAAPAAMETSLEAGRPDPDRQRQKRLRVLGEQEGPPGPF